MMPLKDKRSSRYPFANITQDGKLKDTDQKIIQTFEMAKKTLYFVFGLKC